jgi:hypothetical protein
MCVLFLRICVLTRIFIWCKEIYSMSCSKLGVQGQLGKSLNFRAASQAEQKNPNVHEAHEEAERGSFLLAISDTCP